MLAKLAAEARARRAASRSEARDAEPPEPVHVELQMARGVVLDLGRDCLLFSWHRNLGIRLYQSLPHEPHHIED